MVLLQSHWPSLSGGRGSSHGAAEWSSANKTIPNITKFQNQQVHVKMGWTPHPNMIHQPKGQSHCDTMTWWVCTSGWSTTSGIWPEATRPGLPSFDLAFALLFTVLNCLVHKDSWQELVRKGEKNGKRQGRCLWMDITWYYYHKISVVQIMVLRTSSLYHPWYGTSPCQWQPLDNNNFARPLRSIRAVQKARNSKAT